MNFSRETCRDLFGVLGIKGWNHVVTLLCQHRLDEFPHGFLIFHNQYRFRSSFRPWGGTSSCNGVGNLIHSREINFEGAALARLAVDPDVSAALLHDAIHRRKAKSCPPPTSLVLKKRFQNIPHPLPLHSSTP